MNSYKFDDSSHHRQILNVSFPISEQEEVKDMMMELTLDFTKEDFSNFIKYIRNFYEAGEFDECMKLFNRLSDIFKHLNDLIHYHKVDINDLVSAFDQFHIDEVVYQIMCVNICIIDFLHSTCEVSPIFSHFFGNQLIFEKCCEIYQKENENLFQILTKICPYTDNVLPITMVLQQAGSNEMISQLILSCLKNEKVQREEIQELLSYLVFDESPKCLLNILKISKKLLRKFTSLNDPSFISYNSKFIYSKSEEIIKSGLKFLNDALRIIPELCEQMINDDLINILETLFDSEAESDIIISINIIDRLIVNYSFPFWNFFDADLAASVIIDGLIDGSCKLKSSCLFLLSSVLNQMNPEFLDIIVDKNVGVFLEDVIETDLINHFQAFINIMNVMIKYVLMSKKKKRERFIKNWLNPSIINIIQENSESELSEIAESFVQLLTIINEINV